jgi:demethylmenaquinone methyltransferase/2-methoxy-6-polyprenyl-1,4-benzoquinol methylase
MAAIDDAVRLAYAFDKLRAPVLHAAISEWQPPAGSRGLDAGCGTGLPALLLAEAVGPAGHVTGLDLSSQALAAAKGIVEQAGLSERISFKVGDVRQLPFDDDSFDWAWSMDCVGYAPLEPLPLVRELVRVVRPGGQVAILAWSSEQLLPGYPLLEARLRATTAGLAPFVEGKAPGDHFLRALGWFRAAGLEECRARTFVGDTHAPLSDEHRAALTALFDMRWPDVEPELDPDLRADYRRLCQWESPAFAVNDPDYYAFFTYSMFEGRVAVLDGGLRPGQSPSG